MRFKDLKKGDYLYFANPPSLKITKRKVSKVSSANNVSEQSYHAIVNAGGYDFYVPANAKQDLNDIIFTSEEDAVKYLERYMQKRIQSLEKETRSTQVKLKDFQIKYKEVLKPSWYNPDVFKLPPLPFLNMP